MSITQSVAIKTSRLPSCTAIEDKAREFGFELKIDPTELLEHSGFLPVQLDRKKAGFEWFIDDTSLCQELGIDIGDRDCVVSLVTHSDAAEGQSAMICAAAILSLADGVYFDDYDNVDRDPERLLAEVREWIKKP